MHFPVYSASSDPFTDQALYHKPWGYIKKLLDSGVVRQVSMYDKTDGVQFVQAAPTARQVENLGLSEAVTILSARGSLIPFARVQNPMCKPDSINYPIPACGAHNRPFWVNQVNFVPAMEACS